MGVYFLIWRVRTYARTQHMNIRTVFLYVRKALQSTLVKLNGRLYAHKDTFWNKKWKFWSKNTKCRGVFASYPSISPTCHNIFYFTWLPNKVLNIFKDQKIEFLHFVQLKTVIYRKLTRLSIFDNFHFYTLSYSPFNFDRGVVTLRKSHARKCWLLF